MSSKLLLLTLTATFFHLAHGLHLQTRGANASLALERRFDNSRITFFEPGLGACGGTNTNADFIVALNAPQWDGGSHCFQMISISYNGKSHQAQIVDQCPGCPYGGLDMSGDLFSFFAPQELGVIYGSWDFGSGGGGGGGGGNPQTTQEQTKTTTSNPAPIQTTQEQSTSTSTSSPPPKPTTTTTSSTTTSTTTTSTSSSSTSSTSTTSTSTTSSSSPTATALFQLFSVIGNMGGLTVAAAGLQA